MTRRRIPRILHATILLLLTIHLHDNIESATSLVILLKLGSNRGFFSPCDLEIRFEALGKKYGIISELWVRSNWSYSPETLNSAQNRRYFVLCDLKIWRMTLKNNRAPLLSNIKLCAWYHRHRFDLCDLHLRPLTLNFCMHLTSAISNNSWKFHDDTMMGTVKEVWQTERRTDGLNHS